MEGSENTKPKKGARKKRIFRHIREELRSQRVFGGYFYPGKSHKNTEVEGDRGIGVLMAMRGQVIVREASRHGMYQLTVKSGAHNAESPIVNRFQKHDLPANEVFNEWCSIIASALQEIPDVSYDVIAKPHGRSIRLRVNCGSTRRNVFSVDLIPAMYHGRDFYIASPYGDTWQRSHTLHDKDGASPTNLCSGSSSGPKQTQYGAISREWHSKPDVQTAVREFSDKNALIPRLAKKEAKDYNEIFLAELRQYLRDRELSTRGFEYVGSSFEGLKIATKALEFDILIIPSCEVNATEKWPGFYYLNEVGYAGSNPLTSAYEGQVLPPNEITSKFYGILTEFLKSYTNDDHKRVLRAHGPAVQLDVYHQDSESEVWYSVDFVPAFQSGDKLYVAKHYNNNAPDSDAWRLSYTLSEKRSMNDPSYASRRECVRILKALRARDPTLECITSYMLKTVLFYSSDDYPKESDWKRDLIGRNVLRLLEKLKQAMANRRLDNHKIPGLNLLNNLSEVTMEMVNRRLENLTTKEEAFLKLLEK